MKMETNIDTAKALVVERIFEAPIEAVWHAITRPTSRD